MPIERFGAQIGFSDDSLLIMENLGVTLYVAQLYEHGLQNALTGLERLGAITIPPELNRASDGFVDACIGQMLRVIASHSETPSEISRILKKAHYQRNLLAHRFLMENLVDMLNAAGRASVNDKLHRIFLNLCRASHVVSQLCEQVFTQLGHTPDKTAEFLADLKRLSDHPERDKFF